MTHDPLTLVRFALAYPIMLVCGLVWGVLFFRRARLARPRAYSGDYMASALAFAAAMTGAGGFLGLLYSKANGFGVVSSGLATVGTTSVAVVLLVGVLYMFRSGWRNAKEAKRD